MSSVYASPTQKIAAQIAQIARECLSSDTPPDNAALNKKTRALIFDLMPLREYICARLNNDRTREDLTKTALNERMVLAETVYNRRGYRPENAYSFASKFRESMKKPRYSNSWATEAALTEQLNDRMVSHIRKHPDLFQTAFILQKMLDDYFSDLAEDITQRLDAIKEPNIFSELIIQDIQLIAHVQRRTLIEELLPFFAMAHSEGDVTPEKTAQSGLQKAYSGHAFKILRNGNYKTCPFTTAVAHLLATDIIQDNRGRYGVADAERPGALFGFFHRLLQSSAPAAPKPAMMAG